MSYRTRVRTFALGCVLASIAIVPAGFVAGQDIACPKDNVCVDYGDTAIAIDPAQGPVQAIVVKEQTVTTTTFNGISETHKANLAVYIAAGDTYELAKEVTVDQAGTFASAELGDVFNLTEVAGAN